MSSYLEHEVRNFFSFDEKNDSFVRNSCFFSLPNDFFFKKTSLSNAVIGNKFSSPQRWAHFYGKSHEYATH